MGGEQVGFSEDWMRGAVRRRHVDGKRGLGTHMGLERSGSTSCVNTKSENFDCAVLGSREILF